MNKFIQKLRTHVPWEFFWRYIGLSVAGVAGVIYGILNPDNFGVLKQSGIIILGIVIAIFSLYSVRRFYREM